MQLTEYGMQTGHGQEEENEHGPKAKLKLAPGVSPRYDCVSIGGLVAYIRFVPQQFRRRPLGTLVDR